MTRLEKISLQSLRHGSWGDSITGGSGNGGGDAMAQGQNVTAGTPQQEMLQMRVVYRRYTRWTKMGMILNAYHNFL